MIKEFDLREEMFFDLSKGGVGAELGVCRGFNAINLYHAAKPKKMYLVDLWNENPYKNPESLLYGTYGCVYREQDSGDHYGHIKDVLFKDEVISGSVEVLRSDTKVFLNSLSDGALDWVYLDSGHLYDQTFSEITLCLKKVKKGGYIMGHDFSMGCLWKGGVILPVIEFLQENKLKMVAMTTDQFASYKTQVL